MRGELRSGRGKDRRAQEWPEGHSRSPLQGMSEPRRFQNDWSADTSASRASTATHATLNPCAGVEVGRFPLDHPSVHGRRCGASEGPRSGPDRKGSWMQGSMRRPVVAALAAMAVAFATPAVAQAQSDWDPVAGALPATRGGAAAEIRPEAYRAFTLDEAGLKADLDDGARAVGLRSRAAVGPSDTVISLPAPDGGFAALRDHGVADHGGRPRRRASGDQDLRRARHRRPDGDDPRRHRRRSASTPRCARPTAPGTSTRTTTSTTASTSATTAATSPTTRTARSSSARPDGDADAARTSARPPRPAGPDGPAAHLPARAGHRPDVRHLLRRPANVTAAKVTLMNRVDQIYEDETGDPAGADRRHRQAQPQHGRAWRPAPNGPCGAAACYTTAQSPTLRRRARSSRNRIVLGQLVGAGNYDIGHIALGINGGGVASLGVVGGNSKAQGCTGLPTPVGDFFAVDYVAHEMGHQFAGNHTFNGTQFNCSGGNRNAAHVGRAGLGLVDHGLRRHLPAGQPAAAQRPVLVAAQLRRDHGATSPATRPADQRGADRLAARLRHRRRLVHAELQRRDHGADRARRTTTRPPASRPRSRRSLARRARRSPSQPWAARDEGTCSTTSASRSRSAARSRGHRRRAARRCTGTGVTGFVGETAQGGADRRTAASSSRRPATTPRWSRRRPAVHDPAADAVRADRQRDRRRRRRRSPTCGSRTTASAATTGTALVNNTKRNGPLFRQFGVAARRHARPTRCSTTRRARTRSTTNPTRVFPDMAQILADNTNAATGACPAAPPAPATGAAADRSSASRSSCRPADWVGFLGDRDAELPAHRP